MHPRPILIVDSDPDSLNIYTLVLRHHGFRVLSASDAREGWMIAMRERPQLVLTELFLPKLDGRSFLELLRNDEGTANLPVVAITSLPRVQSRGDEAYGAGYASYLVKPCTPSRLLDEVRQLLADGSSEVESLQITA